jgi:hypothetical protein
MWAINAQQHTTRLNSGTDKVASHLNLSWTRSAFGIKF